MAEKRALVLNPVTGELQQHKGTDTIFGLLPGQLAATAQALANEVTRATGVEGSLAALTTAQKDNLVAAINELDGQIGNLATLTTTEKATLVGAINELKAALGTLTTNSATQAEMDATQAGAGLNADGTYTAPVSSNYLSASTSLKDAAAKLDAALKVVADGLAAEITNRTNADANLQAEIDRIETGAGLNADGTYTAETSYNQTTNPTGAHYIAGAGSLKAADKLLDSAIKVNADAIAAEQAARISADGALGNRLTTAENDIIALETLTTTGRLGQTDLDARYVNVSGDTMTGALILSGAPTQTNEAATKGYVDSLAGGLSWQEPVVGIGAALPGTATTGDRFVVTTTGLIHTATAANTWGAGVAPNDGFALFDKSSETGYVYSGAAWVQFTGTGQITAGLGMRKTGNVLDIDLAAGGALYFNPTSEDNITTHAAIALRTGAGISQDNTSGIFIANGAITNAMLASSSVTLGDGTVTDQLALGGTFAFLGNNAQGIVTTLNATTNTLTVAGLDATTSSKGVASFNADHFSVASGAVSLAATLGDLTNVAAAVDTATTGDVLQFNGTEWTTIAQSALVPALALNDLTDVNTTGVAAGSLLQYNGSAWVVATTGATSGIQGYDAGLAALAAKSSTGVMVQTGADTYASRTIEGVSGQVVVTNGDGVAGNPSIGLATSGVTAGTYNSVTVDVYGRVTTASTVDTASVVMSATTGALAVGTAVTYNNVGTIIAADNTAAATTKVIGFVTATDKVATAGKIGGFTGLTPGARYFLSAAGAITATAPTTANHFVAGVGIAASATELVIQIGTPVEL